MERLGFFGILKVTTKIIHRDLKHFLCIASTLVLPYAFIEAFTPPPNIEAIAASISMIFNATTGHLPPSHDDNDAMQPYPNPTINLIFIIIFISALFIRDLVSVPLITFSICRGYLNKSLKIKGSLMAIPRYIINIILTNLCLFATFTGIMIAVMILIAFLSAVITNPVIPVTILYLGLIVGVIYLSIVWGLAYPVTILEERWGWAAMRRSIYLLDGSKWVAFWLVVFFFMISMLLRPISVSKDASMLWKLSVAAVIATMEAFISLYGISTQVVLYLSCKNDHKEPVETLIAASAQFGEEPAKYMILESAVSTCDAA